MVFEIKEISLLSKVCILGVLTESPALQLTKTELGVVFFICNAKIAPMFQTALKALRDLFAVYFQKLYLLVELSNFSTKMPYKNLRPQAVFLNYPL